jgi:predicted enzyme related to lactoylglutathione lyase
MAATVRQVLARVFVDDLDAALPTYEALAGIPDVRRFAFQDVRLAWVGPFLLLQVPADQRERYERVATLLVDDIDIARTAVQRHGGTVLEGPADAPNGPRMIARHADGAVFEYIQIAPDA